MATLKDIFKNIDLDEIISITAHSSTDKDWFSKIKIVPTIVKKNMFFQAEKQKGEKVFHENVEKPYLIYYIDDEVMGHFKKLSINTTDYTYEMIIVDEDKIICKKNRKSVSKEVTVNVHNRKKNYLLEEGTVIPPLVDMGVFTEEGKTINSKYDKYRQINRFLEIINDVVKNMEQKSIRILDFGCGKSYLTFVLYYYFKEIRNMDVYITGIDLKEDVIKNCNDTAKKYGYENLKFEVVDIEKYSSDEPIDIVVSLHACDTATDFVLFNAIRLGAKAVFSVPCCQHEINAQIDKGELSILTKHGIVKERFSAMLTDTIRANLLEVCGYKTQILEYVDIEGSLKNLLIRAVKGKVSEDKKKKAINEVEEVVKMFNIKPSLYGMLKEKGLINEN